MRRKNLDLIVAMIIAVMNVLWALLPSHLIAVSTILALPLIFLLPGYTLVAALFHKRPLNAPHQLLFSLGLSLATAALSGFILNILPIGLQTLSWSVLLAVLTLLFSLLAAYLRRGVAESGVKSPKFRLNIYQSTLFGLAIAVLLISIVYSITSTQQQAHPGFTQLWMLPRAQNKHECAVNLGIRSFEATPVTYRIIMTMNKAQVTTWPSIVLAPQQAWQRLVPIPLGAISNTAIDVQLYRLDKPQSVYREIHLTVQSTKGKDGGTCTSG